MKEKADQKTSGLRDTWADGYGGALGAEAMGSEVGGSWVTQKTPTPIERGVSRGKKQEIRLLCHPIIKDKKHIVRDHMIDRIMLSLKMSTF